MVHARTQTLVQLSDELLAQLDHTWRWRRARAERAAVVDRGEVWWMDHPLGGRRPACILTRHATIPVLNAVLVVPATRTIRGIPTEVALGLEDGMPDDYALAFDNLGVVSKAVLTERITRLGPAKLAELCAAIDVTTGC